MGVLKYYKSLKDLNPSPLNLRYLIYLRFSPLLLPKGFRKKLLHDITVIFTIANTLDDLIDNKKDTTQFLEKAVERLNYVDKQKAKSYFYEVIETKNRLKFNRIRDFIYFDIKETFGAFNLIYSSLPLEKRDEEIIKSFKYATVFINIVDDLLDHIEDKKIGEPNLFNFLLMKNKKTAYLELEDLAKKTFKKIKNPYLKTLSFPYLVALKAKKFYLNHS